MMLMTKSMMASTKMQRQENQRQSKLIFITREILKNNLSACYKIIQTKSFSMQIQTKKASKIIEKIHIRTKTFHLVSRKTAVIKRSKIN